MKDLTDGGALSLTKAFLKGLAEAVGQNAWRRDETAMLLFLSTMPTVVR